MPDIQGAEELREWIFNTEYGYFNLPRPDVNIFLDVPISFVEKSLNSQRQGDDRSYLDGRSDIHEADIEFQKRVRAMYRRQTEIDPSFISVDCSDDTGFMLGPEEIFTRVRAIIDNYIK